jgi:hypothetical protein
MLGRSTGWDIFGASFVDWVKRAKVGSATCDEQATIQRSQSTSFLYCLRAEISLVSTITLPRG